MHNDQFIQVLDLKQQVGLAMAWAAVGFFGKQLYNRVSAVIRAGRRASAPLAAGDHNQRLHQEYVNYKGDMADPSQPYPQNRFKTYPVVIQTPTVTNSSQPM